MPIAWYLMTERGQAVVRALLPKSWRPPPDDGRLVKATLEGAKELEKLMTKTPGNYRGED